MNTSPFPNPAVTIFVSFAVSIHILIPKTASAIATSIVHSKLEYGNFLYHSLPKSQITRLQQIQNFLACAVVKAPKSSHITPIMRSFHWLKNEHIEYSLLSLTYKVLVCITSSQFWHLLFIYSHTRSFMYIIFCMNNRSLIIPSSMLRLVSGISSRFLSISHLAISGNHAPISLILIHPVLRVALLPLARSTNHSHHLSPFHSSGLKLFYKFFSP